MTGIRSTAAELAEALAAGQTTSVAVTQDHLDRIAAVDGDVHAFLTSTPRVRSSRPRPPTRAGPPGRRSPARRRADRGQGRDGHQGPAHDVRLADPRGLGAAVRRHGRRAPPRGGPADPGQDQHGRVRDGLLHRALGLRADPQPVGPRPDPGRLRRRLGGGRGGVRGAARHRHRHRRLHPPAGRRDGHGRGEADVRRGVALRARLAGQLPRPGRPGDPHRARRGAAARGHRRPRPEGLDVHRRARCPTWSARPGAAPRAT